MPKGAARKQEPKTRRKPKETKKHPAVQRSKAGVRVLQQPKRVWYRPRTLLHHPIVTYKPISKARVLFSGALRQLWYHKKLFGGIVAWYGVLNILLVRGLSGSNDLTTIKQSLDALTSGAGGKLASTFSSFTYLLGTSGSGNTQASGVYQGILLIGCSLAFIWALRQVTASRDIDVRNSFYEGMYPLVPFLLIFLLIGVQLIPLVVGGSLYSMVVANGIAVHLWERGLWLVLFIGLGLWSLRMLTASVFAVYIVTLPDMTPLSAYRSARKLVYGRRLYIWRKLIFLPIMLLLLAALIEVPLILYLTPIAEWTFFVLSMCALPITHAYLYNLYREML